MDKRFVSNEM